MRVEHVASGLDAVRKVQRGQVDIALLEVDLPDMGGMDTCRLIKGITRGVFTPVILLTAHDDTDGQVSGLRMGADDYVSKPFDERTLLARVHSLLRIKQMHDEVADARAQYEALALLDPLTGLYNYRYLCKRLTEEFKRAERYRAPLACLKVTLDFLDSLRARIGRDDCDLIVKEVAERLTGLLREIDVLAVGDEAEFILVLPSTSLAGALPVADRIWQSVRAAPVCVGAHQHALTASIGVAIYPSRDIVHHQALQEAATLARTHAQQHGHDRIGVFQHQGFIYTPQGPHTPGNAANSTSPQTGSGQSSS